LLITISDQAELPLSTVERALYKVAFRGPDLTWLEYGQELQRRINQPPPHSTSNDGDLDEEEDK
jgi:hypothetical protein